MNALILHGIMGKAGENWSQWLADNLEAKGFEVIMPSLSNADRPDRTTWLSEISEAMNTLGDNTIIIAHSLGVTSALDFIEKYESTVKGLVCVAGFADDYGLELNSYFMKEKSIDFNGVNKKIEKAVVFYGDNNPYVPQESLSKLADSLNVRSIVIEKGGHLNETAGFSEFPKLLEAVLDI